MDDTVQAKALADAGEVKPALKTFKDYEPGFLHMDIKYLPQMPDESKRPANSSTPNEGNVVKEYVSTHFEVDTCSLSK